MSSQRLPPRWSLRIVSKAAQLTLLTLLGNVSISSLSPRPAHACSTCACGDPTLTTMGTEKPYKGRLRLATTVQARTSEEGQPGVDRVRANEQRLDLTVTYALERWVTLGIELPFIRREQQLANLSRQSAMGLGDLQLQARWLLWQDSPVLATHLLSLQNGLVLPTGPTMHNDDDAVDADIQPSWGSMIPNIGMLYSFFHQPWSVHVSTRLLWPVFSRFDTRQPVSWLYTTSLQYQPWTWGAANLGVDTRWSDRTVRDGQRENNSGGFIAFVSAGISAMPATDILIALTARIPTLNLLNERHSEGPVLIASLAYDI